MVPLHRSRLAQSFVLDFEIKGGLQCVLSHIFYSIIKSKHGDKFVNPEQMDPSINVIW